MRLALAVVVALVFLPSASAAATCVGRVVCVDAWSAQAGSCGGAGSERNVVEASHPEAGDADAEAETFCVRSGQATFSSVGMEAEGDGPAGSHSTHVSMTNGGSACSTLVFHSGERSGTTARQISCPAQFPPAVPAIFRAL